MAANTEIQETDLLDQAVAWLQTKVPPSWEVARANRIVQGGNPPQAQPLTDAIDVRGTQGMQATFAVEAKSSFSPRDVERILPGISRVLRTIAGNTPLLVVAPWLSQRTQELLTKEGINYIDLTGNARINLEYPGLFLQTTGATRDPSPLPRPLANVRGPKAARLLRFLVDVTPPYGVRDIAKTTALNPGYVSKLLEALDAEALVDRSQRGRVDRVNIKSLLRRWADSYDVFTTNDASRFVAPRGATSIVEQLAQTPNRLAITGSFAAVKLAPVAAPALLVAYCDSPEIAGNDLQLLPADEGANVVLLRPYDDVVWQRITWTDGVRYVAPSQIAVDCLTGNGRMPSEGEALLDWMITNENVWRVRSLADLTSSN
jgi:hypothetical protein